MATRTGIAIVLGCWVSFAGTLILSTVAAQSASPALPNRAKLSLSLNENAAPQRADFVGDSACSECHHDINASYDRTAHYITSQLPTKNSIAGKFTDGKNVLKTRDPDLHFRMDSKPTGFYETAVFWQPPNQKTRSERIDFVSGLERRVRRTFIGEGISSFSCRCLTGRNWEIGSTVRDSPMGRRISSGTLFRDAWNATRRILLR